MNLNYVFEWKTTVEKNNESLMKSLQKRWKNYQLLVVEGIFVVSLFPDPYFKIIKNMTIVFTNITKNLEILKIE